MSEPVLGVVSLGPYVGACALAALALAAVLVALRTGHVGVARIVPPLLGALLLGDTLAYLVGTLAASTFSVATSLPLALCNAAVVVAALACFTRDQLLIELTYFVGLAGTLQAVFTPDLSSPFPHLVFFEYLVGHLGIVAAALVLVVGLRRAPRPGAWWRCFLIVAAYTVAVGLFDAAFGANYMFLRRPPSNATLLSVLGPYPWYLVSATALALALFWLLALPFSSRLEGVWFHLGAWAATIAIGVVVWPAVLLAPRRHRWPIFCGAGRLLTRVLGVEITVNGAQPPGSPQIVVANHASVVDGLVLAMSLSRPAVIVVGGTLGRQRIAGPFLRALGAQFVGPATGLPVRTQLDRLADRLRAGEDLLGFPEGGLSVGPDARRLHLGLFLVATQTASEVVPVALTGTASLVAPGGKHVRRSRLQVHFESACAPSGTGFAAARSLADRVAAELAPFAHEHAEIHVAGAPEPSPRPWG